MPANPMIGAPDGQLQMQGIDPLQGKRFSVRKRDGRIAEFNEARILLAIESAFKAHDGIDPDKPLPGAAQAAVKHCADAVVQQVLGRAVHGEELEVENIQDAVEDQLMLAGHLEVARRYILYREQRRRARTERERRAKPAESSKETSEPSGTGAPPELRELCRQAMPRRRPGEKFEEACRRHFEGCINEGDCLGFLAPELLEFDTAWLAGELRLERDQDFDAGRLEALWERYLLCENGRCLETPQYFWMRIAMGLALNETGFREARALNFYEALSTFRFIPSDAILRNAGTRHPYLSGCHEAAASAGIENVTTQVDGRLGAARSWIEPWHRDILEFLDGPGAGQRFNQGLWIPDLFMKRARQQGTWTLLDPGEAGDLRHCCGAAFDARYLEYEQRAERGETSFAKRVSAAELWHGIVASLARTGQPWLGFKDAVNLRSMQREAGLVSNPGLDGGVLLNAFPSQAAACPLGAINLAAHVSKTGRQLDAAQLRGTIASAVRMLDNAVDLSLYPTEQARAGGLENRAIGLGVAGFEAALERLHLDAGSAAAADFAEWSMELVSCFAIMASAEMAGVRGAFPGYLDSKWSCGVLPIDTLEQLSHERGLRVNVPAGMSQDWGAVRAAIRRHGMRNGATTAAGLPDSSAIVAGTASTDETNGTWQIDCAARAQKWVDMGRMLTLRTAGKDINKLAGLYMDAWEKGIKTARHCELRIKNYELKTETAAPSLALVHG